VRANLKDQKTNIPIACYQLVSYTFLLNKNIDMSHFLAKSGIPRSADEHYSKWRYTVSNVWIIDYSLERIK